MKGRPNIICKVIKQQMLDQLNVNHMGIEKSKLLVCELVYWVNISADINNYIQNCNTCLEF